jgi:hypothetical protein
MLLKGKTKIELNGHTEALPLSSSFMFNWKAKLITHACKKIPYCIFRVLSTKQVAAIASDQLSNALFLFLKKRIAGYKRHPEKRINPINPAPIHQYKN